MAATDGDRIIYVDMSDQSVNVKDFPAEWNLLGGRALSAKIMHAECDPSCDPLGADNVLVMAPGALSGTTAPTSGRISMGGKSPLTNGIKEANAGGNPGQHLMKLGYRAIVVKGQPKDRNALYGMRVTGDGIEVVAADDCKGMWNYALCDKILANEDKKASAITIGPAGERMLSGASIACTDQDKERRPARHAARGGLGAVMGSKGLKYVIIDPGKAKTRTPTDPKAFMAKTKSYSSEYLGGPQMFKTGTSSFVGIANMLHTFVYKNRTEGQSPNVEALKGERIVESFETNGGGMHNCMTGCIVKCSNIVHNSSGEYVTSALEFETLTLLGASCAIESWDQVAVLDRLCDEVGLDTIETGAAIAVWMDSGNMEWGDFEGAKKLFDEISEGTETGRMIGNGACAVGKKTGHKRVAHSHGQSVPAWDPRPLKATGVTYAAGPMGADHTAGLIINPGMKPDEFARASQESQMVNAVVDSSGFCQFLQPHMIDLADYYTAFFGEEVSKEQISDIAWSCLEDEWAFNTKAGWKPEDDVLSDCMIEEGIGPDGVFKFDVDAATIAASKVRMDSREELYTNRGSA
jgi:aldehyde:ferredoxin oxidoreductase